MMRTRRRAVRRVARSVLALALLANLGIATAAQSNGTKESDVAFTFGPDVSEAERAFIRTGIDEAQAFFASRFGHRAGEFDVFAFAAPDRVADAYVEFLDIRGETDYIYERWRGGTIGEATHGAFFLLVGDVWRNRWDDGRRYELLAHESFHVVQHELSGPDAPRSSRYEVPSSGPYWLREGSAVYAQLRAADARGYGDYADQRRERVRAVRDHLRDHDLDLSNLEVFPGFEEVGPHVAYSASFLAAEYLAQRHGDASLLDFSAGVRE